MKGAALNVYIGKKEEAQLNDLSFHIKEVEEDFTGGNLIKDINKITSANITPNGER